jgi:hypothetical protein
MKYHIMCERFKPHKECIVYTFEDDNALPWLTSLLKAINSSVKELSLDPDAGEVIERRYYLVDAEGVEI